MQSIKEKCQWLLCLLSRLGCFVFKVLTVAIYIYIYMGESRWDLQKNVLESERNLEGRLYPLPGAGWGGVLVPRVHISEFSSYIYIYIYISVAWLPQGEHWVFHGVFEHICWNSLRGTQARYGRNHVYHVRISLPTCGVKFAPFRTALGLGVSAPY